MSNTALITGTSSGLGLAIASHLLGKSWRVIGLSRSDSILSTNANYIHKQVDIRNNVDVCKVFDDLKLENINLLINNAAVFSLTAFCDTAVDTIDSIIDTNVKGTMYVTQSALTLMKEDSKIIFINSVAGLEELKHQSIYCASKYALTAFAGVLGNELRDRKIKVTSIHPGGINTPLWNDNNPYPPGNVENAIRPEKLAELVEFVYNNSIDIDYKTIKLFPTTEWH